MTQTKPPYLEKMNSEIEKNPIQMANRHFQMIADADLNELYDNFMKLDDKHRKIAINLIRLIAEENA